MAAKANDRRMLAPSENPTEVLETRWLAEVVGVASKRHLPANDQASPCEAALQPTHLPFVTETLAMSPNTRW
jgi:hypothetical protein